MSSKASWSLSHSGSVSSLKGGTSVRPGICCEGFPRYIFKDNIPNIFCCSKVYQYFVIFITALSVQSVYIVQCTCRIFVLLRFWDSTHYCRITHNKKKNLFFNPSNIKVELSSHCSQLFKDRKRQTSPWPAVSRGRQQGEGGGVGVVQGALGPALPMYSIDIVIGKTHCYHSL